MSKGSPSSSSNNGIPRSGTGANSIGPGEGLPPVPRYRDLGLEHPYVVDPERFTQLSGLEVHPQILRLRPVGHRVIVMMNPPVTEWKGLVVPQQNIQLQQGGSGWVVACGPLVGTEPVPYPGGPLCHPEDLLYCQVIFSASVGSGIRVEFLETRTKCECYTLTGRDIWHIDWNPSEYLDAAQGEGDAT